jgi:uncharacterized protein with HEPN domain
LSPRHYRERIQDIRDEIGKIRLFTDSQDFESFSLDEKTQHAVQMSLIIIGEAGNAIPETIQEEYKNVPWNLIRAMRNRLVHAYFNFDIQMIWDTIKEDIPLLEDMLGKSNL